MSGMVRVRERSSLFEILFVRSWWVIIFFGFVFITYQQTIKSKNKEIFENKNKIALFEKQKILSCKENEDLNLMVNSLSDPEWIEIILMRDLGVVPEGKLKVHFTTPKKHQ